MLSVSELGHGEWGIFVKKADEMAGHWQCRLWWPQHLSLARPVASMALVGWVTFSKPCSLDLVIAATCPMPDSQSLQALGNIISSTSKMLRCQIPTATPLCIVGQYYPSFSWDKGFEGHSSDGLNGVGGCGAQISSTKENSANTCGYVNGFKDSPVWATAVSWKVEGGGFVPRLCYLSVGDAHYYADTHIILYEQPQYGRGHLSCRMWSSAHLSKQASLRSTIKPKWVMDAEAEQQSSSDIERVIEQLNCTSFIEQTLALCLGAGPAKPYLLYNWWRHTTATFVASCATILYILAWTCSTLLDRWLSILPCIRCVQQMSHTWHALHLRCHQLLAWPFILLWGGTGSEQANVAMAHRCAHNKHATWTAIVVDMVLGAIAGVLVLYHELAIAKFVHKMIRMLTNDIMRTGCIWLMGVPAGFKLNEELATRLGTLALHVIQTWATLGALVKPALRLFLPILALLGILMGLTVPVAMLVDSLLLGSIHIAALHQATASLYASQLRALAALWRLFGARKRNPLRGRQDSYECTVEQLVVGSLMFTPLLLLLPTTSVFYTFFTLIYSIISIVRLCLQYLILILQWFPYAEVALWLFQPRRFPSGIWFKTLHAEQMKSSSSNLLSKRSNGSRGLWNLAHLSGTASADQSTEAENQQDEKSTLVSSVGVETAGIGELLAPFAEQLGGVCTLRSVVALMYKSVSGGRIPLALELEKGAKLPHTFVSVCNFWRLCFEAIFPSTDV